MMGFAHVLKKEETNMRKVAIVLLAVLIAVPIFASGSSEGDGNEVLTTAWWGSQVRHDTTLKLLEMYEKDHPGIEFEPQYMGFEDYFPKLNTLVAANDVYDVFQMGNNFLTYQSVLYPLDEFIESGVIDMSNSNPEFLRSGTLNGECLGIPMGINAVCLVYDPALFEKAGIEEPTNDWTWDDYMRISREIHEKLGIYNCCTQNPFWTGLALYVPQHSLDAAAFTDNGDALGYENDEWLADFFEMNQTLINEGVQPGPKELVDVSGFESYFIVSGKAAMAWCNSNELVSLVEAAGRELKIIVPPRLEKDGCSGLFAKPTHHISISTTCKDKEACAEFINWVLNDEEANLLINGERGTSIMSDIRDLMAQNLTGASLDAMEYINTVSELADHGFPREPIGQIEIENELANIFEAVCLNEMTPMEGAEQFRTVADEIFARTAN